MPHGGEEKRGADFVRPHVRGFFHRFNHQHGILLWIETFKGRGLVIQLIAQDENEMAQGVRKFHPLIVRSSQSHSTAAGHATLPGMQETPPVRDSVIVFIALGANLGDARATVRLAISAIAQSPGIELIAASSLYRTAPIESSGPDYINAVVKISTTYTAYSLLDLLQKIEQSAGRERPYRNAPRTLDLDVLLYGGATISSEKLTVPHPRMWDRGFVLLPLREIAADLVSDAALASVSKQGVLRI
jgi:2-amino-4-hydroxy-6-hydroxymethyldihydropteridine diphosphokinase